MRKLTILMPYPETDEEIQSRVAAFREELESLGWKTGQNVHFDERWTTDDMNQVRATAAEIIAFSPDVVFITSGRVVSVFHELTKTIPVVFAATSNPVERGFVASLARPGGNLLSTEMAARSLGISLQVVDVLNSADLEEALPRLKREGMDGLVALADPFFTARKDRIAELARGIQLPTMFYWREFAEAGGLISYGPDGVSLYKRAAHYVDRILKGAKPEELPVEQPTKFELVLNLRTAKRLGLTIPPTLLARADEVIE